MAIMETKYTKIRPDGMFKVIVERSEKRDAQQKMRHEYKFTVSAHVTHNDFINLFAGLVARHGKRHLSFYAKLMGVDERGLTVTLMTLTGAGINEWTDILAAQVAETLLRETTLSVAEIATAAGWGFASGKTGIFSRWFTKRYKCSPSKWREAHKQAEII